ncbi:MAG TPA: Ig-like domain-containing protein [Verrucomicrobiae bacterium]|nr:Ig-like domain-containing protein [Verrucomicrobiae bacterium]
MKLNIRTLISFSTLAVSALFALPASAQFPGGFITKSYDTPNRPRLTQSQIQSFLPAGRGKFTFPAPYNTEGVRITIPTDCGGADCVDYVGYSYWKNMNNHQNSDTMYIVLGLNRSRGGAEGPTLFTYNKITDAVTKVGPLFDPSTKWSWSAANGFYFSVTQPTKLYVNYWGDSTLFRYDVVTHTFQQIFDIASRPDIFGSNRNITQYHSSDDDKVHSFTVQDSNFTMLGCGVYHEDTGNFQYFPKVGNYDECNLDASGRWLIILEGGPDLDNHVIDLQTNTETVILNQNGRLGHLDMGYGYTVGDSGSVPLPQASLLYKFPLATTTYPVGPTIFYNVDWYTSIVNHVSHQNRKPGVAPDQQYACGSNLDDNPSRENEIACFRLDTSYDALFVAPVMTDINAPGGGDSYAKYPKGNLDITGQYFIWTSNMYGNRLDAFIVKVPSQLLTGATTTTTTSTSDTTPPTISGVSAPVVASSSATVTWGTNESSDSQVEYGTTTAYGSSSSVNSTMVTSHTQSLAGLVGSTVYHYRVKSRDAAGNLATSADFSFTTPAPTDTTPPVISGVSAPSVTSSSASVSWVTNEASDSQVEYGTTTAYGSSTAVNSTMVTSHSQSLSSLAAGTVYHYRVKSRDAAGNLATSADFSFTTSAAGDTISPTVAITAPAAGAHVKGKIKVAATASDNVGIVGVQFQLDGKNLGAEDTTAPYTTIWNTSTAAQGYHTLTAVARDQAGNRTTSAPVTVIVGTVTADTTAPTVSISSPAAGTTVSATITVTANAADNVGVVGVQFKLDGVNLGSEDTAAPYSVFWDTTTAANSSHVLTAVARDAAGNSATSTAVAVTVNNAAAPVISSVSASPMGSSGAVIGWKTDKTSNSQVEYGITSAYGASTPLDAGMTTAHSEALSALTANTVYHYRVKSTDTSGNLAVSGDSTFTTPASVQNVVWTSLINTTASGNSLQKTGGCDGCEDAGAASQQQILSGDGYVEFTASESNTNRTIGLSNGNPGVTRGEIAFGLQMWHVSYPSNLEVRENGNYQTATSYVPGDVFRIAVVSGVVKYYKNGVLFYTSTKAPVYPLLVDTSLWSAGATIANAVISTSP